MIIDKTGYGAGTRDFEIPNVTRIYLGSFNNKQDEKDTIIKLETNIDGTPRVIKRDRK